MKNKQAGGIVSFVIVALALAGLLAGGLYLSKYQGRVARDNDTSTPQVSTTDEEQKNQQDQAKPDQDKEKEATPSTPSTPSTNNNQATPQTSAPNATQPQNNRVANTGPSEELPVTGPRETAAVTLALSVLAFTGYRLAQSRRSLRRSALRQ